MLRKFESELRLEREQMIYNLGSIPVSRYEVVKNSSSAESPLNYDRNYGFHLSIRFDVLFFSNTRWYSL